MFQETTKTFEKTQLIPAFLTYTDTLDIIYSGYSSNFKQWYDEPLHTLPHNNVQKLNI